MRFEIGGAQPTRDGVRREDGHEDVDGVSRALTKTRSERDNRTDNKSGHVLPVIRVNGVNVDERESARRWTDDAEVVGENGRNASGERERGDPRIAGENRAIVDIVQRLVESR